MAQQLCRIVHDPNHNTYLVSDRVTNLTEGAYVLDESREVFFLCRKELIPVEHALGLTPVGDLLRIEASSNHRVSVLRLTPEFILASKDSNRPKVNLYVQINSFGWPKHNEVGQVMVKTKLVNKVYPNRS